MPGSVLGPEFERLLVYPATLILVASDKNVNAIGGNVSLYARGAANDSDGSDCRSRVHGIRFSRGSSHSAA